MWHVDEGIIKQFDDKNEINTADHRPGLMPTYMEYDEGDTAVFKFIGSKVDTKRPFFDDEKYGSNMSASEGKLIFLPTYNGDDPSERVQRKNGKGLLISGSGENISLQLVNNQQSPTLKAVSIKKPVAGKKSMIVRWKKLSKNDRKKISKIQIQYSTDKKFRKNVKTTYAGKTAEKKKIKNLKRRKRYYIRVRAYKKNSTGVQISKWSKVKNVKLK